jgi:hypothetical protein
MFDAMLVGNSIESDHRVTPQARDRRQHRRYRFSGEISPEVKLYYL